MVPVASFGGIHFCAITSCSIVFGVPKMEETTVGLIHLVRLKCAQSTVQVSRNKMIKFRR
jgi:hypothetical protein